MSSKFQWLENDFELEDSAIEKNHSFFTNEDLSVSIRSSIREPLAQTLFRESFNHHIENGKSETLAFIKAYRALEKAGMEKNEDGIWIIKDSPSVGDVHVDSPLGTTKTPKPEEFEEDKVENIEFDLDEETIKGGPGSGPQGGPSKTPRLAAWIQHPGIGVHSKSVSVKGKVPAQFPTHTQVLDQARVATGTKVNYDALNRGYANINGRVATIQTHNPSGNFRERPSLDHKAVESHLHANFGVTHTYWATGKRREEDEEVIQEVTKYLPPLSVHQAAKSAYDLGTSVLGITSFLAEQEGLPEVEIRNMHTYFQSSSATTAPEITKNAWGGITAPKWVERIIKKLDVEKGGPGSGPQGGRHSHEAEAKFKPSEKMLRAMKAYKPCNVEQQRAADKQEAILSKALGIPQTKDNSAFDLRNDDVGVELKTVMSGKNEKITMNKEALGRKVAEASAEGLKTFTVVADTRSGKTQYMYSPKLGSLRLGGMTKVSLAELRSVVRGAI